jgi:hypothetical protein
MRGHQSEIAAEWMSASRRSWLAQAEIVLFVINLYRTVFTIREATRPANAKGHQTDNTFRPFYPIYSRSFRNTS